MEIRIGYSKALGIGFVAVGAFIGAVAALRPTGLQVGLAALFVIVGVLHLRGVAAVVTEQEFQVKNFFGGTVKRYPITSLADVTLNEKNVLIDGKRVLPGMMLNGADVAQLGAAIEDARTQGS